MLLSEIFHTAGEAAGYTLDRASGLRATHDPTIDWHPFAPSALYSFYLTTAHLSATGLLGEIARSYTLRA